MANQLKLDILVDDHGGIRVLQQLDAGVNKVVGSTKALSTETGGANVSLSTLAGSLGRVAGIAFTGAAAFQFITGAIRETAQASSELVNASERLGAPIQRLEQIKKAAAGADISLNEIANAIGLMQQRLSSGDLAGTLGRLGINLEEFVHLNPANQFLEIADAVARIEDPAKRAEVAVAAFGRSGEQLRAILVPGFRQAADEAHTMSESIRKDLDAFMTDFEQKMIRAKELTAQGFLGLLDLMGRGAWSQGQRDQRAMTDMLPGSPFNAPTPMGPKPVPGDVDLPTIESMTAEWKNHADAQDLVLAKHFAMHEALDSIAEAQRMVTAHTEDWADVMDARAMASIERVTAAITQNMLLAQSASQNSAAIIDRLRGGGGTGNDMQDRVNEIMARADRAVAGVDPNAPGGADAIAQRYNEANLEIAELAMGLQTVKTETEGAVDAATRLTAQYDMAAQKLGGFLGGRGGAMIDPFASHGPRADNPTQRPWWMPTFNSDNTTHGIPTGAGANAQTIILNMTGVMAADKEGITRLVKDAVMEATTQGRKLSGAR